MVICSREEGEEEEGVILVVKIYGIGVGGADALRLKENVAEEEGDKYLARA